MASIYYLSFHKAPPLQISENDQYIAIAPTIHNDLREDVYCSQDGNPLSVTVAWLIKAGKQFELIEEACIVLWLDSTQAYKNVQVKVPSSVKAKELHLALYVKDDEQMKPWQFNLMSDKIGQSNNTVFVPALSAPIKIKRRNVKSESITEIRSRTLSRLFEVGLKAPIVMEEQIGFDLEGHLWDAALHLVRWLHLELKNGSKSLLLQKLKERPSLQVLELGAGTGFVSIALSALLSSTITKAEEDAAAAGRQASIIATDLMPAIEVLQRNMDYNLLSRRNVDLHAEVLDWEEVKKDDKQNKYDFIFVADCTYNPAYFDALCHAIRSSLQSNGICLLAKKHRHIDEDNLWNSIRKNSLTFDLIHGNDAVLAEDNDHAFIGWGLYQLRSL